MRKSSYDSTIFILDDNVRKIKLLELFKKSVDQDIKLWTVTYSSSNSVIKYKSPNYKNDSFVIEFRTNYMGTIGNGCIYLDSSNPIVSGCNKMCIIEWETISYIDSNINKYITTLRNSVFSEDIKSLDGIIGTDITTQRKNKLVQLEMDELREKIDESFHNWAENPYAKNLAQQIALTANILFKTRSLSYSEWYEKFKDYDDVIDAIKKFDKQE